MKTIEYLATVGLVLLLAWLIVHPIAEAVADAMDNTANIIAKG